ncbi:MAG: WbqC family protein [Acidobacteriota bacterium]|nr:WbqC family protein [Blastocatellia bacterium]MDW8240528.1 WbqC family protein [Acidobacteriota bacterium]
MNCVILQPSYIPWRGYFHQIYKADVFVFYDDVQYDKHGWRNRNRIKTSSGTRWLTIPVLSKGVMEQRIPINQVRINPHENWGKKHFRSLRQNYGKAPYFDRYAPLLEEFYARPTVWLADLTIELTIALARELGITRTQFLRSSSLRVSGSKTERLVEILTMLGATHYISGPSAKNYLEEEKLAAAGISLEYMIYDYPEYEQLYPPFDPHVSIVDLLFMTGPDAAKYIWDVGA